MLYGVTQRGRETDAGRPPRGVAAARIGPARTAATVRHSFTGKAAQRAMSPRAEHPPH